MSTQTLMLRLAGPQQAWGSRSRFATRGTERAPTRSGVLGLVAAALGFDRTAPLDVFDRLRFGVRIDRVGSVERDFQTARTHDGKTSMPLSDRHYLADAVFLAGLESDDGDLLERLRGAIRSPHYPLYLGRRAFPPAGPVQTWIVGQPLLEALAATPWQARGGQQPDTLEILVDARPGDRVDLTLADAPRSFDPRRRRYDWRDVTVDFVGSSGVAPTPTAPPAPSPSKHDPFALTRDQEV